MKKGLTIVLFAIISFTAFNQTTSDIFQKTTDYEFVYLGVDFSKAKFIGDFSQFAEAGATSMEKIKNFYFNGWNNLVIKESDKYDIAGAMEKWEMTNDLDAVFEMNQNVDEKKMAAASADKLSKEDIQDHVKTIDFKSDKDIGFLFIVEYFDKNKELGCIHFVALNLKDNSVLLHERYLGEAGGFGLRNYWARTIYETIKQVDKQYRKWRKEYR